MSQNGYGVCAKLSVFPWAALSTHHGEAKLSKIRNRNCGQPNALPIWGGVQVAVDTTLVSPVRADGALRPGPTANPASPCARSAVASATTWRCRLLGRGWRPVAPGRGCLCAPARTCQAAPSPRTAAWSCCAGVCAALGCSSLSAARARPLFGETCVDSAEPPVSDLLADAGWANGPAPSRLPA